MATAQSSDAWAFKQVGIAAGFFLVAASARGLGTCPMEGVDSSMAVRAVQGSPARFVCPLVVSLGYAAGSAGAGVPAARPSALETPRRPMEESVFDEVLRC